MTDPLSRLQTLTCPSRELDAEIALANGWTQERYKFVGDCWKSPQRCYQSAPPRYTESIEAALMLLPKGWAVHTIHSGRMRDDGTQRWVVDICRNGDALEDVEGAHGSSPAIALVIACLKEKKET